MNAPLNHPMPLLELDVLRTFVAIAETGSFTTAANAVFRTPSAVSMQIKKLEDILGRSVFSRDARSVSLTTDGEMLLGYARRMLAINREAVSKFIVPDIVGVVRLGSPDDYGERVLPHVLKRFAQSHPSIAVDVVIDQSSNLRRRMDERTLDITLITNSFRSSMAGRRSAADRAGRVGRLQGRLRASARAAAGVAVGRGLRLAGRRARCAGQAGPQLPRRLYERAHGRPARGDPGRSRGGADAEIVPRRRHGRARRQGRHAGDGHLQPGHAGCARTPRRRSRRPPTISARRSSCSAKPDGSSSDSNRDCEAGRQQARALRRHSRARARVPLVLQERHDPVAGAAGFGNGHQRPDMEHARLDEELDIDAGGARPLGKHQAVRVQDVARAGQAAASSAAPTDRHRAG